MQPLITAINKHRPAPLDDSEAVAACQRLTRYMQLLCQAYDEREARTGKPAKGHGHA